MARVAVIGAGPSGLAQLRAFQSARKKGAKIPEVVCFEKQADWGGLWNYTWRTGLDEYGEPVHGSMYRYLWSNGPKECLEFADYTFEEHFGKPIGSYPPRAVLWDYIKGRVEKAGVRKWVRFSTPVRMVTYSKKTKKFTVTAHDRKKDKMYSEEFDHVVVASGHFSTPNVPYFDGLGTFNGRVMHSHDFRDALEFKGKDVLVVGRSYSAEDIGSQCWKYGAKSVTTSYRSKPMGFNWPANFKEHPLLQRLENKTAHFKDGSSKEVDAIILCTGYLHHFPFLPDDLRLKTANRLWPLDLYKGVVFENNPKLFYIGMQDQFYTFNMFDAQAWYARDVIMGRIKLPTKDKMTKHTKKWRKREEKLENAEQMIWFQGDYVKELLAETDYPNFDIEATNKTFMEWEHHKAENIMGFRNNAYRSLMTGTLSPAHHTPWVDAMDDSMECYLGDGKRDAERRQSKDASPPDSAEKVRAAFRLQAEWCRNLGSPFTSLLCGLVAERLDRSTAIGEAILDWQGDPDSKADSVPLRFAGALNGLVRKGLLPELKRLYPPNPLPDGDALWAKVEDALSAAEANIKPWLALPPQTNEVGRSSILFAGLCWLMARYPLPMRLYEVGASAGLNLNLDRYAYRFGEDVFGAAGAALFLTPEWEGRSPPNLTPRVSSRTGCDLSPLDASNPRDRERLLAYVWPDQAQRVKRLTAALGIAAHHPVKVERSDAAAWVERNIAMTPAWGEQQVLFHSIAFQYFPKDTQEGIAAHMERAGASATRDAPLAWLRFEVDPELEAFSLRLRVWPTGEDHLLATGDPHGSWVKWTA